MKVRILTIFLCLFLSGCGPAQMAIQNETKLINETKAQASESCGQYGDIQTGMPKSKNVSMKFHNCVTAIADKTLIPQSSFPDIWLQCRAQGRRVYKQYGESKIDVDEFKSQIEEINAACMGIMNQRLAQAQEQQNQASQRAFQNWATMQQMQQANQPQTTNCIGGYNSVSCTTY